MIEIARGAAGSEGEYTSLIAQVGGFSLTYFIFEEVFQQQLIDFNDRKLLVLSIYSRAVSEFRTTVHQRKPTQK